jgi:hypothetical protein
MAYRVKYVTQYLVIRPNCTPIFGCGDLKLSKIFGMCYLLSYFSDMRTRLKSATVSTELITVMYGAAVFTMALAIGTIL